MYNIHLNVKVTFWGIYIMFMWELDIISAKIQVNINVKENINYKNTFYIPCKIIVLNEGRNDYFVIIN